MVRVGVKRAIISGVIVLILAAPGLARDFMVVGPAGTTIGSHDSQTGETFAVGPGGTVWTPPGGGVTFDWHTGPSPVYNGQTQTMRDTLGQIEMQQRGYDYDDGE